MNRHAPFERIVLQTAPFSTRRAQNPWDGRGPWDASWIRCKTSVDTPFVTAYRLRFELKQPIRARFHVSADERYELFIDGVRIGRGSERGDVLHWFYESYEGEFSVGPHTIVARVWSLGEQAPFAQISVRPGFLLAADETTLSRLLDTGVAGWEAKCLGGYTFQSPLAAWGTGANVIIEGRTFDWGFEQGAGTGWMPASIAQVANDDPCLNIAINNPILIPAQLPEMLSEVVRTGQVRHAAAAPLGAVSKIEISKRDHLPDEALTWQAFLDGKQDIIIPPRSRRRIIIDLANYYCAYHQLISSGGTGGSVEIHWQESLYETAEAKTKGNRDVVEGKFFITTWHLKDGIGDRFQIEGGSQRRYEALWWHCGRYIQLLVETADEPLILHQLLIVETRYPFIREGRFASSNSDLEKISALAWRTLEVCSHETYFDCPYFEQLQYVGDTRIEALVTYISTCDSRLPRKAIQMFDWSRTGQGLTQSRYPCGIRQIIPAFSLLWIGMVHDFFMWRDEPAFVRARLPGMRAVLDYWLLHLNSDGSIGGLEGWNYLDWAPAWKDGTPPEGKTGGGASFNFLLQISLQQAAEIEQQSGEAEQAIRWRRYAGKLAQHARELYWDEARGLFADDAAHSSYSEHAQSLGVLANAFSEEEQAPLVCALRTSTDLVRTTIYFTHYYFEALRRLRQPDLIIGRTNLWHSLHQQGLKTTVEMPEPTRSDCHAWSAHPLFHYAATLLGIRPAEPGFQSVEIIPQLGSLEWIRGKLPHPNGEIEVEVHRANGGLSATIKLPVGLEGTFIYEASTFALKSGQQTLAIQPRATPARTI